MKVGIEVYISIVLITIMAVLCSSFIIADVKTADARDAYYSYCSTIESSGCSEAMINACISDAGNNGYQLSVEEASNTNTPMYKVKFIYNYKIAILGINKPHTIVSYISG